MSTRPFKFSGAFAALFVFAAILTVSARAQNPAKEDPIPTVYVKEVLAPAAEPERVPGAIVNATNNALEAAANALYGDYGWFAKAMTGLATLAGFLRIVVKPLWSKLFLPRLERYVASTADTADDELLHAFLDHKMTRALFFVLDLITSVKIPAPK